MKPLSPMKPLKCRRKSGLSKPHGIASRSMEQCVDKGCKLLKIDRRRDFKQLTLLDGTIVEDEDYFNSLERNAVIIFETKDDTDTDVEDLYRTLSMIRMNSDVSTALIAEANRVSDTQMEALLTYFAEHSTENTLAETRDEDPDWFKGVSDKNMKTKSKVLESSAMNRVRSYFYEAKQAFKEASCLPSKERKVLENVLVDWQTQLKIAQYYKHYFSRTARKDFTFCDDEGLFLCEGDYISSECCSKLPHKINPYQSRECRIFFSTWNLDHQIEKARTVVPQMIKLALLPSVRPGINWDYFYELMFTRENLKLVHIACHIKQEHTEAKIRSSMMYC